MPDPQRLLTIGFGYSANATARAVLEAGWRVTGTTRRAERAAGIEDRGVTALIADPATSEGALRLQAAAHEADAILISVPPGDDGDPVFTALAPVNLTSTRLIYLSTTGVYGDRQGGWAFEWDPVRPGQARSVRRAQAEAGWLAAGALSLRLGGIYGPGRSAFDRLAAGNPVVDKPGQLFSRIHVADIAAAVVKALARPQVQGPINLVDDVPTSQADLMRAAADIAGLPPPLVTPYEDADLSPMAASFFSESRRVSNARAKAMLGWRPRYRDPVDGLRAIFQEAPSS